MNAKLIVHQLFEKETSTYTYLIADPETREAALIDPVIEMIDRDLRLIEELDYHLLYILDTHVHADHITAAGEVRKRTGAKVGISSAYDLACADLHLEEGQELWLGHQLIQVINTPGHTSGCISYKVQDQLFTGDALLIRGCGRTDFQEGSSETLFQSVREKLFQLPDETVVYPGHDYRGFQESTIGLEKKLNPRLNLRISKDEFTGLMANLKLALPKKIQEAVPANFHCGLPLDTVSSSSSTTEVPVVRPEDLNGKWGHLKVIDVRGSDEFNNDLGHIPGAELVTLGPELQLRLKTEDKEKEIIFVCRSGRRSAEATKLAREAGFKNVYNLEGGMLKWNELRFPFERDMGGS